MTVERIQNRSNKSSKQARSRIAAKKSKPFFLKRSRRWIYSSPRNIRSPDTARNIPRPRISGNVADQIGSSFSYDDKLRLNAINKIGEIHKLEDNWNENGAKRFSDKLILKCYEILFDLAFAPEIFPVADGSIQFEYEKNDGSYLEIDIFEDEIIEYRVYPNGNEVEQIIDADKVYEEVKSFYE